MGGGGREGRGEREGEKGVCREERGSTSGTKIQRGRERSKGIEREREGERNLNEYSERKRERDLKEYRARKRGREGEREIK